MNRFQNVWSNVAEGFEIWLVNQSQTVPADTDGGGEASGAQDSVVGSKPEVQDDTTVKAASAISEALFDHKLIQSEKKIAGPAVHYIPGTGVGGLPTVVRSAFAENNCCLVRSHSFTLQ